LREDVQLRLKSLEYTVDVAKRNFEMSLYVPAAFYVHLAVEKALKTAIIALCNELPEKTHRLQRLYGKIANEVPLTEEQIAFLEELTPVVSRARYEDIELADPSEIYTEAVVKRFIDNALPIIEKLKAAIMEK